MSRTLTGHSPAIPESNGSPVLVPIKLQGIESLNQTPQYTITLITPDEVNPNHHQHANFNLDDFIGQPYTAFIEFDDGSQREITGLITQAHFLRQEGRNVVYQIVIQPWLHLTTLTSDCKIFQDKTVVQILEELLKAYPFPATFRISGTYPTRDYQVQYNETDYTFFNRLCQEWGFNYHFEYADGAQTLVISDAIAGHPVCPGDIYGNLHFNSADHREGDEHIHAFTLAHQLVSGAYSTRDYDYTRSQANLAMQHSEPRPTEHADLEIYQWHEGAHYSQPEAGPVRQPNNPTEEGSWLALTRLDELHSQARRAEGEGSLRGMRTGYRFTLQDHPQQAANTEYLILDTRLLIEELNEETQSSSSGQSGFKVNVWLSAYPTKNTPYYRPSRSISKPIVSGPHTALVVGPANTPIHTDDYGRVKVEFPWDRYGKRNENSSCWLRVASPFAGNQMGGVNLPRIGQEVLVEFIGGDPDLPLCTAQLHNQFNLPPWQLPEQLALSGFRSRELTQADGNGMGRSNHFILDDTEGKIQAQLKSDHQHSQLSLGHITRIEDNAGRKDARGEGFELRSDGHGVMRAAAGMLITTEGRTNAQAHITDMAETTQRLKAGHDQQESMASIAQQYGAQERNVQQELVAKALKAQNDAIKGTSTGNPKEGQFPELEAAHLVLSSPAGIHTTTPQSTHIASGEHLAISTTEHTAISSKGFFATIGETIRLFVQKAGMKLIAAGGDIDVQALQQNIKLLAKLKITETAEEIIITGKKSILINGGGSYIELKSGSIELGTSQFDVFANMSVKTPKSKGAALPQSPNNGPGVLDLYHNYSDKNPVANADYAVRDVLGKVVKGKLDANGFASVAGLAPGPVKVFFGEDPRNPWEDANQLKKIEWPEEQKEIVQKSDPNLNMLMHSTGVGAQAAGDLASKLQSATSIASGVSSKGGALALLGEVSPSLKQATSLVDMAKQAQQNPASLVKASLSKLPRSLPPAIKPTAPVDTIALGGQSPAIANSVSTSPKTPTFS